MQLISYPKNLQYHNEAIVLDTISFGVFAPVRYPGIPIYTTTSAIAPIEKLLERMLERNLTYQQYLDSHGGANNLFLREKIRIAQRALVVQCKNLPQILKSTLDLIGSLDMLQYFTADIGFLVEDKWNYTENIISKRLAYYREKIDTVSHLVPKTYLYHLPTRVKDLHVADRIERIAQIYRKGLSVADPSGKIGKTARKNLLKTAKYFAIELNQIKMDGFQDDVGLVALAYALPAENVRIFSRDTDIRSLVDLARSFLEVENNVTVCSKLKKQ